MRAPRALAVLAAACLSAPLGARASHALDPVALETELNQVPGIVTNGIFARRPADHLLLASAAGIRRIDRGR